ncbi:NAD(P)-binding protein [Glonium stellatum]|uniref:NAD(P)-binding protein n=1 Tax=Glonium stellatum TaxID=574774 RepID=A0A8E2JMF3_9PEZI|nr:NAD(P)-binding protein [Glonium stellatum]
MATSSFLPSLTKLSHSESYPAISPSRPELSVKDKAVVITGGGSGIGASIAKAFAAGGSTKIAIISRTEKNLLATKHAIEEEFLGTEVLAVPADITNARQVDDAFLKISQTFDKIDVLVCNSAFMPVPRPVLSPDFDVQDWWTAFSTNILGALYTVQGFVKYAAKGAHILHISTCVSHMPPLEAGVSAYAASKAAGAKLFDYIAFENPGLHVVNVHPGLVDTNMSRKSGHGGMDHIDLSGHFCLWLVSSEANFLRGKFVWVNWDVDELKARKEEILSTDLLDTKLGGVSFVGWEGSQKLGEL